MIVYRVTSKVFQEKALACYDGDVSRVVDISRDRIIFRDGSEVFYCNSLIVILRLLKNISSITVSRKSELISF